jgi:hypothetical protein
MKTQLPLNLTERKLVSGLDTPPELKLVAIESIRLGNRVQVDYIEFYREKDSCEISGCTNNELWRLYYFLKAGLGVTPNHELRVSNEGWIQFCTKTKPHYYDY